MSYKFALQIVCWIYETNLKGATNATTMPIEPFKQAFKSFFFFKKTFLTRKTMSLLKRYLVAFSCDLEIPVMKEIKFSICQLDLYSVRIRLTALKGSAVDICKNNIFSQ